MTETTVTRRRVEDERAPLLGAGLSAADRDRFESQGYLLIPNALDSDEVERARGAVLARRDEVQTVGGLDEHGALHQLSAVSHCPELTFLLDHANTFGAVWSLLGWNVHVYHSHVDVHPGRPPGEQPHWGWHQDGGRQNRELETDPRPRLSVKIAYWLSDVSASGRGNLTVLPGSHRLNRVNGPPRRSVHWPPPPGATEILARPGDALLFDRRLWHVRSDNHSDRTRVAAFFGYTYRWIAVRDDVQDLPSRDWWVGVTPVQRQLLGGVGRDDPDHAWGHHPQTTPLYRFLAERGRLTSEFAPLIPDAADGLGLVGGPGGPSVN